MTDNETIVFVGELIGTFAAGGRDDELAILARLNDLDRDALLHVCQVCAAFAVGAISLNFGPDDGPDERREKIAGIVATMLRDQD